MSWPRSDQGLDDVDDGGGDDRRSSRHRPGNRRRTRRHLPHTALRHRSRDCLIGK